MAAWKSFKLNVYSAWIKRQNKTFLELLEHNPKAKVIDLGCGDGTFTQKVRRKIGCAEIYGVDTYQPFIKKSKKKGIKVKRWNLNKFPYPLKTSFDVIVSNQVIEHLLYPVRFLKEIFRLLKPNGYAVISTENLASWDNIFALVLGYTPFSMEFDEGLCKIGNPLSPHNKKIIDPKLPRHNRIFTYKGLIELAEFIGFKVEKIIGSGHVLGGIGEIIDKRHCRFVTIKVRK
jgi:SAM-dependent methyltransferase